MSDLRNVWHSSLAYETAPRNPLTKDTTLNEKFGQKRFAGHRRLSRPARLALGFLAASAAVGFIATVYGLLGAGPSFASMPAPVLLAGCGVVLCTIGNLLLRFVRWHYLLRRFDVRVPAPPSLGAFVGSFAFLPVPLYLGQLVARARLMTEVPPERRGYLHLAFLLERALDVWTLALLSFLAAPRGGAAVLVLIAIVLVPTLRCRLVDAARTLASYAAPLVHEETVVFEAPVVRRAAQGSVFAVCTLLSLGAWGLVVLSILPLTRAAGIPLSPLAGTGIAAKATLLGALSLIPVGAGASGLMLFRELGTAVADTVASAQVTFIFRVGTAWLTVGTGAVALLALIRWRSRAATQDHFDAIDACYDTWLPPHFRMHLVAKKTGAMLRCLAGRSPGLRGLDIGCGRGWYLRAMEDAGARMVGIDTSGRQLVAAQQYLGSAAPLARASMLSVPFRGDSFDFAYVINVLHHLPPERQLQAIGEVAEVVRPGGLVFVHEMNVINPLFRFYLGYVFPILKGIEEGDETYLDPRKMGRIPGLALRAVHFFTFVPDFVPAGLLPLLEPLERRLETSVLARYAAHFLAVYERIEDGSNDNEPPLSVDSARTP